MYELILNDKIKMKAKMAVKIKFGRNK